jgi:hypothetical protein
MSGGDREKPPGYATLAEATRKVIEREQVKHPNLSERQAARALKLGDHRPEPSPHRPRGRPRKTGDSNA